ncbi:MAG TPA: hypothetical protein DD856_05865 [Sulfobacillus sp.]|nr:hypothetical protein [Sulfobacillus sp.]
MLWQGSGGIVGGIYVNQGAWSLEETQRFFGARVIYNWGKRQIFDLRCKAKQERKQQVSFNRFHEALLSYGMPMVPVFGQTPVRVKSNTCDRGNLIC